MANAMAPPIRGELTAKQHALVEAVVNGAPTITAAGKTAGYSHLSTTSAVLRSPKIQAITRQRLAERRDTAKELRHKAMRKAHRDLESEEPDALRAVQIAGVAATIEEKIPEDAPQGDGGEIDQMRELVLKAFAAGLEAAGRDRFSVESRLQRIHNFLDSPITPASLSKR